ncbi:MAG: glycosyltransferase family 2 protein [Paraclostridium dentum]|uniref:glycosyltransferase family 2 protein n=1 Tax=Paraclostridium dentum TaxID=2662455 RepID=UPI003EE435AF
MEYLVSVIIPMYNAEKYIEETILSVINQTYKNLEIIIVDDKSIDNSASIVKKFELIDKRIKHIKLNENKGVANARNIGVKASNGRFIAFIDSDDVWRKNKIEKQLDFMLSKKYGFTFTAYEYINEKGKPINNIINVKECTDYKTLLKGNIIGCSTVMIDKNKIQEVFMPKIRHEDYITWLNILKSGECAYGLDENLGYYRKLNDSLSGNKIKAAKWTWDIYRSVECLPIHKCIYYFTCYALKNIKKHFLK